MVATSKLASEDVENFRSRRKCGRGTLGRVIAISVIVFVALTMSVVYYGIVLERMETIRQIMRLKLRHQHNKAPTPDAGLGLEGSIKLLPYTSDTTAERTSDSDERSLHVQHLQMKYFHRRLPRDVTQSLEPMYMQNGLDFAGLYAKVRDKRTKLVISKLEKEYVRCKKEFAHGNDCMVAFVKMYQLAKEISTKMEKMKAIFKDSEFLLNEASSSNSKDSSENGVNIDNDNTTVITKTNLKPKEKDIKITNSNSSNFKSESLAVTTEAINKTVEITQKLPAKPTTTTTTTTIATTTEELEPVKISWIIDGNEDFGIETQSSKEHKKPIEITKQTTSTPNTMISTVNSTLMITTTLKPLNESTEHYEFVPLTTLTTLTTVKAAVSVQTTLGPFTTIEHMETSDGIETTSAAALSTKETSISISESTTIDAITSPDAAINETTTLDGTKVFESSTMDNVEDEQAKLRKLKFEFDRDMEQNAEDHNNTKLKVTTERDRIAHMFFPTKPLKLIKYSWIIDSDDNAEVITEAPKTKDRVAVSEEDNINLATEEATTAAATTTTPSTTQQQTTTLKDENDATTFGGKCNMTTDGTEPLLGQCKSNVDTAKAHADAHPLDYPSSMENMLDSFERNEGIKSILPEHSTFKPNMTSTTANPQERKEWHKKFNERPQDELIDSFGNFESKSMMSKFGPQLNPANTNGLSEADSEFMTLCERMAKRKKQQESASKPNENLESHTQPPSVQFTSRGPVGFPVTGETMKASAQFMFNPNFGMPMMGMPIMGVPVCFLMTPASYRMMNQAPMWMPSYGMSGMYGGGMHANLMGGGGIGGAGQSGVFFMPQSLGTTGNFFSHPSGTAGGGGTQGNIPNIFSKNASPQKVQQQFYCTVMQNQPINQNEGGGGGINFPDANFKMRHNNQTSATDIIYASYANLPDDVGLRAQFKCELPGEVACYGGNECVRDSSWCDGTVECSDGSDEAACTCRDRLANARICDGYADCPMGEDEVGCFGCTEFMYSCYDNTAEYERFNRSTISMCFSKLEKCDGFINCLNGKDEQECSIIVNNVQHHMSHSVSNSEGFLYHNHRGDWFPVCNNGEIWAKEACSSEGTTTAGFTNVTFRALSLPGPFIEPLRVGTVHFPQSCQKRDNHDSLENQVAFVKCPPPQCGARKKVAAPVIRRKAKRNVDAQLKERRNISELDERIVGGSYSKPLQWPFVVALYRNGNFHCGGTIFSELWIITAAHCVINYQKYHYEARAGIFRRSSYAVSTQIQPISHVVVHQAYERRSMRNDLALLRVAEPLQFNRWVKPICLPAFGRTTNDRDWLFGPTEKTLCTAVGWGAIREKGPGSDQLREVTVPIRRNCTEKDDLMAADICAGDTEGGRDACQGDSGGPLFCRSVANADEWYLAGIVSHGNGCARRGEFGVYTRVALYLDWIGRAVQSEFLPKLQPLQLCPGYVCVWGGNKCIPQRKRCDRNVDCLGGEDEVGCTYNFIPDVGSAKNGTITSTTESDYFPEYDVDTLQSSEGEIVGMARTENPLKEVNESVDDKSADELETFMASGTTQNFHAVNPNATESAAEATTTTVIKSTEGAFPTTTERLDKLRKNVEISEPNESTTTEFLPIESTTIYVTDAVQEEFPILAATMWSRAGKYITDALTTEIKSTSSFTTVALPTTTEAFSKFESNADAAASPKPHTIVQKRENATGNAPLANKFICEKIPQIVELSHRCDRIVDCEDGTDENDCKCRDYLKGSLNILICDGKTDCEDLTDEEDCGNCQTDEFLCPLSKTCVPLAKRCDDIIDCSFKEDEQDCFALTNGKEIFLDANKQPKLSSIGIFSRNKHGVWRIVCAHDTGFRNNSAKTADEVCALIGFKGFTFYNTTEVLTHHEPHVVPIDPSMDKKQRFKSHLGVMVGDGLHTSSAENIFPIAIKSKARTEHIERVKGTCLGLYLECKAKSDAVKPLKTISAGVPVAEKELKVQNLRPTVKTHSKPNVYVKPQKPISMVTKQTEIMDKLDKVIEYKKNLTILVDNQLHAASEELHWPWLVDIYMNGSLWCIGVLVDESWVMVHETCNDGLRFDSDYLAALFGGSKTRNKLHRSMHEQIRRIDCHEAVASSDVLLYHLELPVDITHYVVPTFFPDFLNYNESVYHECISALHDYQTGRVKTVAIVEHKNDNLCKHSDMSCYQMLARKPPVGLLRETELSVEDLSSISEEVLFKSEEIDNDELRTLSKFTNCMQFGVKNSTSSGFRLEPIDQGVLVCRTNTSGWFPTSLFAYNNTDCSSFRHPFGLRTLENVYKTLQQIIEHPKCAHTRTAPSSCSTLRCPLGACLAEKQICNGQQDCHDGSDEFKEMCLEHKKACQPSEMKCRSSQLCIPKTKFCDHVPDCDDLTDEPTICSCFTYLKATDPTKICDGIRNCWDKSDESPVLCNCTENHFRCGGGSKECIPRDFVCDKQPDCPNGEDEKYCYGIEHPLNPQQAQKQQLDKQHWTLKPTPIASRRPPQYGQVIEQTYGIWHTKCFPRDSPPEVADVRLICKKLGYNAYRLPSYRLIDNEANEAIETYETPDQRGRNFGTESLEGKYRDATKAVVVSKFSPLRLNEELTLFMKPSRPIAELMRWNATDSSKCFRLEIKCA